MYNVETLSGEPASLETHVRLPISFSSIPGKVEIDTVLLPNKESKERIPTILLIQNIMRHTRLKGKGGRIITPHSFSELGQIQKIALTPKNPQYLHENAIGSILFMHDTPILSIVSDYLRLAQAFNIKSETLGEKKTSWAGVISSLFQEFSFYDAQNNRINPRDIHSCTNSLFGNISSEQPFDTISNQSFLDTLFSYLNTLFEFDFERYTARVRELDKLNVYLGSAQRAITPFCFANCKEGCRFCYVDRRLSSVVYPNNWIRNLEEIKEILRRYNPETRFGSPQMRFAMMDWEPTEHPDFLQIIKEIAKKDPKNQIPIVTHGGNLTEELLLKIANDPLLKKLVLFQVSLNSADPQYRRAVMPGKGNNPQHHENAIASLEKMHKLGIAFDVSLVAVTNWLPMSDILNTISFADRYKPYTYIRVALPTATKDHPPQMLLSPEELASIDNQIVAYRDKVETPIILTVGLLNRSSLDTEVEGVVRESPAWYAGIRHGVKISTINGVSPRSRTEATLMLLSIWKDIQEGKKTDCFVNFILTNGSEKTVNLSNYPQKLPRFLGEKPVGVFGLLLHDDVDYGIFEEIHNQQKNYDFRHPLIVTSQVMAPFFNEALSRLREEELVSGLMIVPAKNYFFGGNVCIAGLLTFTDILKTLQETDLPEKPT